MRFNSVDRYYQNIDGQRNNDWETSYSRWRPKVDDCTLSVMRGEFNKQHRHFGAGVFTKDELAHFKEVERWNAETKARDDARLAEIRAEYPDAYAARKAWGSE